MKSCLLVHPGASWATADLWRGVFSAMQRAGVDVVQYALDGRIAYAGGYLEYVWRRNGKPQPKYNTADVLYLATSGMLERALRHQVDWVIVVAGTYVPPETFTLLRRAGLRVATILTESPYCDVQEAMIAARCDVVFTNERSSLGAFRAINRHTYYWQHAYDAERHTPATGDGDPDAPAHDVVFVGTGFQERCDLLSAVDWRGIDFGLYGSWGLLGSRSRVRRALRAGVVDNRLTAALYRNAKIGLNIHRTSIGYGRDAPRIAGAESLNPRCYELAATGRFFVTDYRAELDDVFAGVVPVYTSPAELEAQVRRYVVDDAWRADVAAAALERVRPHTFDARVREMLDVLDHFDYMAQ